MITYNFIFFNIFDIIGYIRNIVFLTNHFIKKENINLNDNEIFGLLFLIFLSFLFILKIIYLMQIFKNHDKKSRIIKEYIYNTFIMSILNILIILILYYFNHNNLYSLFLYDMFISSFIIFCIIILIYL